MSETSLKFGPEWLRALSHGGTVSSPPSSPGPAKFKLAEFRYGREEMLALFSNEFPPPDDLNDLGSLYIEQIQEPLACIPMEPEEHRMWQRCVNSEAVLRSTGRAPINGVGRGRGGSIDRGRGRGRGAPYYSRGVSYDDETDVRGPRDSGPPGMPIRTKGFERSQSTGDTRAWAAERGTSGVVEERAGGASSPRKEQGRSLTDNWRSRGPDEDGDRWKGLVNSREKWGPRAGWREREMGAEGEWEEGRGPRNSRPPWESDKDGYQKQWEEDHLPEWAMENNGEKGGSFDATGNFYAPSSSEEEEGEEEVESQKRKKNQKGGREKSNRKVEERKESHSLKENHLIEDKNNEVKVEEKRDPANTGHGTPMVNGILSDEDGSSSSNSPMQEKQQRTKSYSSAPPPPHLNKIYQVEDDKLEHMQSVADDLVAKLVEEDEPRTLEDPVQMHHPSPAGFMPNDSITSPPIEDQWYYTDPQGHIQGPFSSADMAAWCKAGYFKPDLLLRRQCDDKFAQLGDLTRVFGRVPFLPGPPVPPLKVSELFNAQKAERERYELMQSYQLQKQLYQQQVSVRQQQVLQQLQGLEEWSGLSQAQQQQLFVQHMMSLPPIFPPTLSPSLQGTDASVPPKSANQPPGTDLGSSISQQDPIQAFVAQMTMPPQTNIPGVASEPTLPISTNAASISAESPLQKLLLQLQRGPQSGVGNNLNTPVTNATIVAGHPSTGSALGHDKPPEQFDAIQSLMTQLSKIQIQTTDNQEELRKREQERIEEERKRFEKQKRAEEERIKLQEMRLHEERIKEEERRKELEEKNQRLEEKLRRIQEEQIKRREEDSRQRQEERRNQQEQQKLMEHQRKEEEQKKQQQTRKNKQEEDQRKKEEEEKRHKMEEKKKMEEEKRRVEEEKKRKEDKERQQQIQIQEEMKRIALEEERRRMHQLEQEERRRTLQEEQNKYQQQQKVNLALHEKLKQNTQAWNNKAVPKEEAAAPSLAEIQRTQEVKERKEREAEAQRESQKQKEALRQAAEERKQKEANIKWASRVSQTNPKYGAKNIQTPQPPIKSLLEIQKEEEKELKKKQEKEQAERAAAISHLSLNAAGVWGSAAQSLSWANRASSGAPPPSNPQGPQQAWGSIPNTVAWSAVAQSNAEKATNNSSWNNDTATWNQPAINSSGGFWENPDSMKGPSKPSVNQTGSNLSNRNSKGTTIQQGSNKNALTQAVNISNKVNKKRVKDESENVRKLFVDNISPADSFTQWCKTALHSMKVHASIDIPTFVGFLNDVESPYEVHDYIRSYLGDSKEVKEFAKQYLERRSKARNAQKEKHEDDNILAPAPAVNPISSSDFQEVKTRLKKGKKKMQKVDNSILGFNVASLDKIEAEDGI